MKDTPGDDRARLEALLHTLPLAAVFVGVDDRVVGANERFARLFRLAGRVDLSPGAPLGPVVDAVAELYARPYRERYERPRPAPHPQPGPAPAPDAPTRTDAAETAAPAGAVEAPRSVHRSAELPLTDGRVIRRQLEPLRHRGRLLGTLWTAQDVTARKRAERDLERDNRTLSELIRHRSAFAASASHELRTPLAAILSFWQLLATPASGHRSPTSSGSSWRPSGATPNGCTPRSASCSPPPRPARPSSRWSTAGSACRACWSAPCSTARTPSRTRPCSPR